MRSVRACGVTPVQLFARFLLAAQHEQLGDRDVLQFLQFEARALDGDELADAIVTACKAAERLHFVLELGAGYDAAVGEFAAAFAAITAVVNERTAPT
jgi:ABC-type bacteriocin/lantibiotic exporter with double-glycine peptidase domain